MSKKVVVRLIGGLGNQMFAYAAAKRLAMVNGADLIIDNITGFVRDKIYFRNYELNKFDLNLHIASAKERMEPFSVIKRRISINFINSFRAFENRTYIKQYGSGFDERLLNLRLKKNLYLEGVWQSENYFKDIENTIRQDFKMIPPNDDLNLLLAKQMQQTQSVALHVRFYDELHLPKESHLTNEYYKIAVDIIKKNVNTPHFFIFSENIEQAKKLLNLNGDNVTYINHNTAGNSHFDLWLMTKCKYFIIANSTFSWWGAWLAEYKNKLVIAPNIVLHNWYPNWRSIKGVLPMDWIKI